MKATAPSRIGLFGGGTDLVEYSSKHTGMCISIAVNLETTVTEGEYETGLIKNIRELHAYPSPLSVTYSGIMGSGIGSSASGAVATIGYIRSKRGQRIDKSIITDAYLAELSMDLKTGIQDQAAAYYGGMNLFIFNGAEVDRIEIPSNIAVELWRRMILVHTGFTRQSSDMQQTLDIKKLDAVKELVKYGFEAIVTRNWGDLKELYSQAWEAKKSSNPQMAGTIGKEIDRLCQEYDCSAKIMGAGGGGYVCLIGDEDLGERVVLPDGWERQGFIPSDKGLAIQC